MDKLAYFGGKKVKQDGFFMWPYSDENETQNLLDVLKSGKWWRATGDKVQQFENEFAKKTEVQYCLGVTNGTHALELSLSALGIGEGDEVIVPAITFISTVTAVIYCNAIPVIVDVDADTYCMDIAEFENAITSRTKAVIPVHIAGNACDMDKICEICKKHGIHIIEDAAHAHGGRYNDKAIGSFGDMATFSFQNGKIMTCGEGGAIITNNSALYKMAYLIHGVGRPKGDIKYVHQVLGSNYRMSEFQAAILLAQLERLDDFNARREKNYLLLNNLFNQIEGIKPQTKSKGTTLMTHYMYMFRYDATCFNGLSRDKFVEFLKAEGIPCFICFPVLSDTKFFENSGSGFRPFKYINYSSLENAHNIADNVIWIPHYTMLGNADDMYKISDSIKKIQKYVNNNII